MYSSVSAVAATVIVAWLLALTASPVTSQSASYVGCYVDSSTDRLLQGHVESFTQGLTHDKCNQLCFEKGFTFAGTQNGFECYCGDYNGGRLDPVDEDQCNLPCNGDHTQKCGGYLRLTAYRTGIADVLPVGKTLGCFNDNQPYRILNGYYLNLTKTNSPVKCLNICRKLGYKLAGVKNTDECHCGNDLYIADENGKALTDEECQVLTCPGDASEFCGDVLKLMLYRTGPPDVVPDVVNIGCYKDRPGGLLTGHSENMGFSTSHTRCVSRCFQLGFDYTGIKKGNECTCGDYPTGPPPARVVTSKCNIPCPAKPDEMCGGDDELTGYNLGLQKFPVNESIGCFRNELDRYLNYGYKVDLMRTNSPLKCVNICRQLNFRYAGLENRFRCYCTDILLPVNENTTARDSDCSKRCTGDVLQTCGGRLTTRVYETGLSPPPAQTDGQECEKSVTTVNNEQVCKGAEIFKETFKDTTLNLRKWQHVVQISGNEEYEFVVYNKNQSNCYIDNSKLIISPSVLPDELTRRGKLELEGCTGTPGSQDCKRQASSYNINPPVQSAQVNTKDTFNFRYGIVNIRAKLPAGDWIIPQLLLKPKEEVYGPHYRSGVIRIVLVKGNTNLICDGKNMGTSYLESGVLVGTGDRVRGRTVARTTAKHPWTAKWHNYTVIWRPESISFAIDGKQEQELLPIGVNKISDAIGFSPEESTIWNEGTALAPFDKEFYIALGVSAGGMREFPNDCLSNGRRKPWNNFEVKGMLKFWQDKANWEATWNEDSRLQIENVVVKAL